MNATPSKTAPLLIRLGEVIGKLHLNINVLVPEGYQDEQGFHFGAPPAEKQITWPPED